MTDPTQFIVDQQNVHRVLTHEGLLGRGRDFLSGHACSLHLYNDQFKRTYVMQQFEGVDQEYATEKMTRIAKCSHTSFACNLTRPCLLTTRKNSKGSFDLSIFYDATGVYGYSLEYVIKMKVKNEEKFSDEDISGFFWQISDFLLMSGELTGEFLEITPVNIFCKPDGLHGYNFFPNNFGLSFQGTKWERKYHNLGDNFWKGERNIKKAIQTVMFTFGMVMLQMCSLLSPSDLYTDNQINEKLLKKRIEGIKITTNPLMCQIISSLLAVNEQERLTIKAIYENKELLKTRKVDYYVKKPGLFNFKYFEGLVGFDKKVAVGEALDDKACIQRGRFEDGKLHGFGLKEQPGQTLLIGVFAKGEFEEGLMIRKNESVRIIAQGSPQAWKGFELRLNICQSKTDKKHMTAFQGELVKDNPSRGRVYFSDGSEQQI